MCRKLLCLLGPLVVPFFCGCSGFVVFGVMPTPSPTPLITVSVSPSSANMNGMKSRLFTAIVTGTANPAVTWSIAGPGCSGLSCGSIAANGVYKAPPTVPNPAIVTVTATSNADRLKVATASVTVLPALPVTVAVTPGTATVPAGKTVNLAALVTNTPNTAVDWSVAGAGCSGAACGTISSSVYTAPPAAPSPAAVIVTATSQADPTKADQAVISIVDSPGALITGTFIYLLNGFDNVGGVAAVGSMTFHSDGTFVASEDEQFSSGVSSSDSWSGIYTIASDGRGTITGSGLRIGTRILQISVLPGDEIRFVQFNSAGMRSSGVMRRTSATTALAGDWAFEFGGVDNPGSPLAMIGRLQLDSNGNILGSYALDNINGLTQGQLSGNYAPPLAGRSTAQLVGLGQTLNWVFYIVNENELFWLMNGSRDPMFTQLSGRALRRTGAPFNAQSLDAATVLSLTGNGWLSLGALSFDGAISASGTIDQKTTFFTVILNSSAKADYSVDSVSGCGSLNLHSAADTQQFMICLVAPNHAFVLQVTGPTAGQAFVGEIEPRIGVLAVADLLDGAYNFGSERPGNSQLGLAAGTLTSSAAVMTGTADITLPSSDTQSQAVSGSITTFNPATGRGTATLNLPGFSTTVFYVVSNGRVLFLPMATGSPGIEDIVSVLSSGR